MTIHDLSKIKKAANYLSQLDEKSRNCFLYNLAENLMIKKEAIIQANQSDIRMAEKEKLSSSFIQRLCLDTAGLGLITHKLTKLSRLKSRLGSVIEKRKRADGLSLKKVVTPLGVIFVIFEARPEVTIDVAALCLKSGNAAILKGGREANNTNKILYGCILDALDKSKIYKGAISLISERNRKISDWLLQQHNFIDLVIARGGYVMVKSVIEKSKIPVLAHAAGGARIYVDESADLKIAEKIIINAKTDKPAACNSLDTIVIHRRIAKKFIKQISKKLDEHKVNIVKDFNTEFLGLTVSIKIVDNADEATDFINKYTKGHSEGIVAADKKIIEKFNKSIDAAAIFVNCSSRLHDGYEFGMGSEMGIATGKLHARGPVGLRELATYKWIIEGEGHVRN